MKHEVFEVQGRLASENGARVRRSAGGIPWLPLLLGAVTAIVLLGVPLIYWVASHRIPYLTDDALAAAEQQWQVRKPDNYRIQTLVTGRQGATYAVEVTEGQPVSATRNGNPLPQKRIWGTWSVDGMFRTIRSDIRARQRQQQSPADPSQLRLLLRAAFDPQYGFPRRYVRVEMGQSSDVSWQVQQFQITAPAGDASLPGDK